MSSPTPITCDTVAAARHHHIKPSTIRQWLHRGHLTHHGHDQAGRTLIDLHELQARLTDPPLRANAPTRANHAP